MGSLLGTAGIYFHREVLMYALALALCYGCLITIIYLDISYEYLGIWLVCALGIIGGIMYVLLGKSLCLCRDVGYSIGLYLFYYSISALSFQNLVA